nr:isoform 2 of tmv resistance protein n [Quercus suber]
MAPSFSVLIPLLFLSLGNALQLGLSVGTMAYSMSQENSPTLTYEYEVFVSFSAEDTHKSFTCHLFVALDHKGIHVYKSGFMWTELMKAIEKSRIAVVVFSKNYGNLEWCLDELVKIMECKRLFNQRVIPIFYNVSPSEVRKQMGNFTEALLNGSGDKVNSWRVALTSAANLAGFHLKPFRLESEFIEEIVENIWTILNEESATAPSRRQIDGRDASILLGLLKEFIPISSLFLRVYSKDHYGKDAGTYVLLRWLLR